MLLGWAQCARCERRRAGAIPSAEFFEKVQGCQLSASAEFESLLRVRSAVSRKGTLPSSQEPVNPWGSRFCRVFSVFHACFQDFTSIRGRGVGRLSAEKPASL